jgi:HEPN domain-containing protein
MPPRIELVREWIELARKDMAAARRLLEGDATLFENACFHMQQAIEKALKGVLLLNEQKPPRTHNLADLFGLCERWLPGLSTYEEACEWLSACAVDARYPGPRIPVTLDMAKAGLAATESVIEFVLSQLPRAVNAQGS